ncbi:antibiotic biosynthesis monooxygenase family protein [Streptomyces apocyni]|uniref:antibiotic biosynthesis monooxygenase n=1 Tax=Streptomyces apocyni TaxID=2654677 RepID=UPI0012EA32ED|nr:antibiotic biosynthesis monooxygenase [Streptomyces apocyni]
MPDRDLGGPVTVVNRFTVTGDTSEFEREFREHSQFLRQRPGFDFLVTVRLVDAPQVYVHLGHWKCLRGFLDTVHDDVFLRHVRRLGPLVETEADQAVSVGRVLRENAEVGVPNVVLTWADVSDDWREFERRFAELDYQCDRLEGFGGSDLLRSTVQPLTYTGVQWWRTAEDCERALRSRGYRNGYRALSGIAKITTERTRHIAYERVIA